MNILTLDIETTPNLAHVWGIWQQNVGINQILESTDLLCFAAKWHDDKMVQFFGSWDGRENMVHAAHDLLADADAVVHYNGNAFDIPTLNREFLLRGLTPPAPQKQIDLLATCKRKFRFQSNKLDFVARELGIGNKADNGGHETWIKVMAGDEKAQRRMRKYNEQDVRLTEALYDRLLPWIEGHPNVGLHDGSIGVSTCPSCGSYHLNRRGFAYTAVSKFQQYQCQDCGRWVRASNRIEGTKVQGVAG